MKRKILGVLLGVMLIVSGCGQGEIKETEQTQKPVEETPVEKQVTIYYVDEETGELTTTETSIQGDLSEGIIAQLKEKQLLSADCKVQDILVNEEEKQIELDMNNAFGEYIRGMGTSGSEVVLECVAKSYLKAYDCEKLKITEDGDSLDTGHTVLDGYISYE